MTQGRQKGALVLTPELASKLGITPEQIAQAKEQVYLFEMKAVKLEPSHESALISAGGEIVQGANGGKMLAFRGYKKSDFSKDKCGAWFSLLKKDQGAFVPSDLSAELGATIAIAQDNIAKMQAVKAVLDNL